MNFPHLHCSFFLDINRKKLMHDGHVNFCLYKVQSQSCADQSHRIPSYQPDQLIEKHLNKKQCGARYSALSSIRIHFLLSVYLLHYTCTIKKIM